MSDMDVHAPQSYSFDNYSPCSVDGARNSA
jgi:hypothetical protein